MNNSTIIMQNNLRKIWATIDLSLVVIRKIVSSEKMGHPQHI